MKTSPIALSSEYDNDPDDPNAPYRSAQDSAIFAHFRRNPAARPELSSRNYLGVSVPSDVGSIGPRRSRRSRGSIDALRKNPFGADYNSESEEDDRDGQAVEVDLASWGLDAFIPKEKSKSAKSRGKQPILPPVASTRSHLPSTNHDSAIPLPRSGVVTSRPLSEGANLDLATQDIPMQVPDRRRSFGSPLDLVGMESTGPPFQRRRAASQVIQPQSIAVPFPSSSVRPSPGVDQLYGDSRPRPHERTHSMASMASRLMSDDMSQDPIPRWHERTHSMVSMASRLMPEESRPRPHERTHSMASMTSRLMSDDLSQDHGPRQHERIHSMASMASRPIYDTRQENIQLERFSSSGMELENAEQDNPFAIHHPSHISRFDPKVARTRTQSSISMGSRMVLENHTGSVMTENRNAYPREPRYATTMDLLRPKVLVMPSPLQAVTPTMPKQPTTIARDGFEISTDGPPLPPGARTSRRLSLSSTSIMASETIPLASNSFIPNPHIDLSLSQKTFRNTLLVGGRRGSYIDVDGGLPRATEDGEQVMVEELPKEEILLPPTTPPPEEDLKAKRPAGKLYGKSLIDDLENRKAQMRSKQRYLFLSFCGHLN